MLVGLKVTLLVHEAPGASVAVHEFDDIENCVPVESLTKVMVCDAPFDGFDSVIVDALLVCPTFRLPKLTDVGDTVRMVVGVGVAVGVAVRDDVGVAVGVAVRDGVGVGVGLGDRRGVGVTVGVAVAVAVGVGVGRGPPTYALANVAMFGLPHPVRRSNPAPAEYPVTPLKVLLPPVTSINPLVAAPALASE